MTKQSLTQETLKSLLHYNPDTGIFTWLARPRDMFSEEKYCKIWNTRYAGKEAGTISRGYRTIKISSMFYLAHRLTWLHVHGEWPADQMDHINHKKDDNRLVNLRSVTGQVNRQNTKLHSTNISGFIGVRFNKAANKWISFISVKNKDIHLGCFNNIQDAVVARKAASMKHGYHANHGLA